jgi:hypothetical protein
MSLPRLRGRLVAEPDPDAKATMLVALGLLAGAQAQTDDAPRLARLLGDADTVVRWGAAVALARLFPQAPPEPAVRELLGWLTGQATAGRHPEVLFCDPQQYALLVMGSVPVLRERAAEAILARLPALSGEAAHSPVWDLVLLSSRLTRHDTRSRSRSCHHCNSGCCGRWRNCRRSGRLKGTAFSPVFPLFSYWGSFEAPGTLEELRERLRAYTDN